MIESHFIKPPRWAIELMGAVHAAMQSGVKIDLGYRLKPVQDVLQLLLFPLPSMVHGGREDGLRVIPFFSLDIFQVADAFNSINDLSMQSASKYNTEGSEFRILGLYQNRPVLLRVLSDPPPSAPSYMSVDGITGEVRPRKPNSRIL